MERGRPIISVIMPIYNVELYLEESLKSVLDQTLINIEIICIDDGSTDNSGKILDKYTSLDKRIIVIHKENSGYGHSMNMGIMYASGEYVAILEPDDMMKKDMLKDLYMEAMKYDVDFVKSDYAVLSGEKENYQITPVKTIYKKQLYEKILEKDEIQYLYDGRIAHWTGIYRRRFLLENKILFNETPGASYQDTGFWFQTLFYAKRVYLIDNDYYCYRQDNPNSSVHSKEKVYCICKEYDFIFEKLKDKEGFMNKYLAWYIKSRFEGYKDTLDRIADEYKKDFIINMSEELKNWKQKGFLDLSRMRAINKTLLYKILENPESFYEEWKCMKMELNHLCEDSKIIYIYGAGYVAGKIFALLSENNRKKICAFVVTEKEAGNDIMFGYPVYEYCELEKNVDRGIILGVSEQYKQEIKNILVNERNIIECLYWE